jgi:PST family polysaccharide transporter
MIAPHETATAAERRTPAESPLERKVRRGSLWLGGNTLVMRFSNIAVMAVVARLVAPDEFGIFTLAVVANTAIVTFAELGVASAIARRDLDERVVAPTAVSISVGINVLLGGVMAAFAVQIASALGSAAAAPSIRILAMSVAMSGLFVVPTAQLQRDFKQSVLFRSNFIGTIVGAGVLIGLATLGNGAEAFAWSRVIGQAVTGFLVIIALTTHYPPGWNAASLRLLLRFGVPLAAANLLSQVIANVDYVFVGHTLSLREVGLYTLAFNVASWASSVLGAVLSGVVLPAFSAVRAQGGDVAAALFTASRAVALVSFPIAAITSGLARPLIETLYGPRWVTAAPVVVVLSVYGAATAIGLLIANILIASGRTVVLFTVQLAVLAGLVPGLWLGITSVGLIGVGLAHVATAVIITLPVYLFSLRRALGTGLSALARGTVWPLLAALATSGIAHLVAMPIGVPVLQVLAGGASAGAVYLILAGSQLVTLLPQGARGWCERHLRRFILPARWTSVWIVGIGGRA